MSRGLVERCGAAPFWAGVAAGAVAVAACRSGPEPRPRGAVAEATREFRGVWVATVRNLDWPSKPGLPPEQQRAELIAILERAAALRLNALILQVRPDCDALYESALEPWSEFLTGTQGERPEPFYDPLAFAIREAHARGIELHVWFNPYRAGRVANRDRAAPNHISRTRPDLVREYGPFLWLDPGAEEVRRHTLAVILDVVRRYDVDGVHMDDYFYPYPVTADGARVEFPDEATWDAYAAAGGTLSRGDWRRKNVDDLVRELYEAVKRERPRVKVGISPFGIWKPGHPEGVVGLNQYEAIFADARKWLREGWVDYLAPQLYWSLESGGQPFEALLTWWRDENVKGRYVWPGLYTGRFAKDGGQIPRQIEASRKILGHAAAGHIHFSARTLTEDRGGIVEALGPVYASAARAPEMPWLDRAAAPSGAAHRRDLEEAIAARLRSFRGTMGVAAKNLETGEIVLVDADRRFPTASAIKTAVMVEVYHQIAEGKIRKDTRVRLSEGAKVGGSGVLQRLHGGLELTVADLLSLMMTVSDNTATNLLVDLVGTLNVDKRLASYGLVDTKLFRPTFRQGKAEVSPEQEREFGLGMTTPRELARLMELIAEGQVIDRAASDEMMEIMRGEAFRAMIPRGLPNEEGLRVANKPGWDEEKLPDARGVRGHVRVDAAIVTSPRRRYVIAVCARHVEDSRFSVDNEANVIIAEIARAVHDGFSSRVAMTGSRARAQRADPTASPFGSSPAQAKLGTPTASQVRDGHGR